MCDWSQNLATCLQSSIMCKFKIVARSGGRATRFNVRNIGDARKPVRIVSVILGGTGPAF